MIAMRDNIPALANGDAGAPRIKTVALEPPGAGDGFLIGRFFAGHETVFAYSVMYYGPTAVSGLFSEPDFYPTALGFSVLVGGTIRLKFDQRSNINAKTTYVRVLKNGTQVIEYANTSSSFVTRSLDITVSAGDNITLQGRTSSGGDGFPVIRNVYVYSNNPNFAVA
jgi:hypothetical protein